jgi:hypothetical protein
MLQVLQQRARIDNPSLRIAVLRKVILVRRILRLPPVAIPIERFMAYVVSSAKREVRGLQRCRGLTNDPDVWCHCRL